jgi:hypothetical protein
VSESGGPGTTTRQSPSPGAKLRELTSCQDRVLAVLYTRSAAAFSDARQERG